MAIDYFASCRCQSLAVVGRGNLVGGVQANDGVGASFDPVDFPKFRCRRGQVRIGFLKIQEFEQLFSTFKRI